MYTRHAKGFKCADFRDSSSVEKAPFWNISPNDWISLADECRPYFLTRPPQTYFSDKRDSKPHFQKSTNQPLSKSISIKKSESPTLKEILPFPLPLIN